MLTVRFDGMDSYADYGLIRKGVTVGSPAVKTETVDVPGADGTLDLTEYFGEPLYDNRELEMEFQCVPGSGFHAAFSKLYNAIHGKRCRIQLSEDPDFYYVGRVSVDEWKTNERTGDITVTADCEPYKYRALETVRTVEVSGETTETFANLRKTVVPTFELSVEMQIRQGDSTFSATSGTWSDGRLRLRQGDNALTFIGTGTATVRYQERGL